MPPRGPPFRRPRSDVCRPPEHAGSPSGRAPDMPAWRAGPVPYDTAGRRDRWSKRASSCCASRRESRARHAGPTPAARRCRLCDKSSSYWPKRGPKRTSQRPHSSDGTHARVRKKSSGPPRLNLARWRSGTCAGKGLLTEAVLKSPIFHSEDSAIDRAAMLERLRAMQMGGHRLKECRGTAPVGAERIKCGQRAKFPIVGFAKTLPASRRCILVKRERKNSSMSSRRRPQSIIINGNPQESLMRS